MPGHKKSDYRSRKNNQAKSIILYKKLTDKYSHASSDATAAKGQGGKHKNKFNKNKNKNKKENHFMNNVTGGAVINESEIIECWVCHQQGDHRSNACPNGDITVTMKTMVSSCM